MPSKKKVTIYLSISLTIILPRGFDVYMIYFFLPYYLNLLEIVEKKNKGGGCVVKMVETKLRIQYIKNNLQQLKEIAVFIIYEWFIFRF